MTDFQETQLIWLQRYLEVNRGKLTWHDAEKIIQHLKFIEDEYWTARETADELTHVGEKYGD